LVQKFETGIIIFTKTAEAIESCCSGKKKKQKKRAEEKRGRSGI